MDQEAEQKEMQEVSFHPTIYTNPKNRQVRDPEAKPEDYLLFK